MLPTLATSLASTQGQVGHRLSSAAVSRCLVVSFPAHRPYLAQRVRSIRLNKQVQEHVDSNPDLRTIVDEFSVPGKYHKYLFPSKRQLKRDAKVAEPPAPEPWASPSSSLQLSTTLQHDPMGGGEKTRVSKKMAQRVSRAIHDILYDPHFGVSADTGEAPSWRVDKIDVAGNGKVTVWWVPADDMQSAMLMDNDAMVEELNGMAKLVKRSLQSRLKLRKSEVPKIVFMRRDTSLELLLDIVEEELVVAEEQRALDNLGVDGAAVHEEVTWSGQLNAGMADTKRPIDSDDYHPRPVIDLLKKRL